MKHIIQSLLFTTTLLLVVNLGWARELEYPEGKKNSYPLKQTTAGCSPAAGFEWLDINNVRARINTGGDMWWDLVGGTGAKYSFRKVVRQLPCLVLHYGLVVSTSTIS